MPGLRRRFGPARKIHGGSGRAGGGLSMSGNRVPRVRMPSALPNIRLPKAQVGPLRIQLRAGLVIFDRSVISTNWNAINRDPLQKAGNFVRLIARRSIKRRPRGKASAPGTPPFSHRSGGSPPFKQIYNVPDHFGTRQLVGMVGYGSSPAVPGLHELGGSARRSVYARPRWGRRQVMPQPRNQQGQYVSMGPKFVFKQVRYPMRPFMRPALAKSKARIPGFWRGALSRRAFIQRGIR